MMRAGRLRSDAGQRVVVGWVERHGRAETRAQIGDLEVVPPRMVAYGNGTFAELDVEAVVASGADIALVDELAHTVVGTTTRRWQEVADILVAGIDVMTTANLANLVSARDYVAQLTGAGTVESVPDEFVRSGQTVLVDLPADTLRRRIADGKVYSADQVGGALADYFRVSNLQALSALGRAWVDGTLEAVAEEMLEARRACRSVSPDSGGRGLGYRLGPARHSSRQRTGARGRRRPAGSARHPRRRDDPPAIACPLRTPGLGDRGRRLLHRDDRGVGARGPGPSGAGPRRFPTRCRTAPLPAGRHRARLGRLSSAAAAPGGADRDGTRGVLVNIGPLPATTVRMPEDLANTVEVVARGRGILVIFNIGYCHWLNRNTP